MTAKWFQASDLLKINQRTQYTIKTYSGVPHQGLTWVFADKQIWWPDFSLATNWPDKGRNWLAVNPIILTIRSHLLNSWLEGTCSLYQLAFPTALKLGKTDWQMETPDPRLEAICADRLLVKLRCVARFCSSGSRAVWTMKSIQNNGVCSYHKIGNHTGFYDFAEPTKKGLQFYSDYIRPVFLRKLANIQSNSVSGGMESATLHYSTVKFRGRPNRNAARRNVVIHEIAHQWFGNSVTEYDLGWCLRLSEGLCYLFTCALYRACIIGHTML